ncbi:SigB/SigF/SigG family RNA polymerase sigma factor [Nonomuraea sp. NPDC047897]|uniref:SigB/SigF/SigG family RNA polymerase sigma factor n=1 Tax=Nonomuraea sp. NPDC047897 TaxID=3364346 RepID=UPI00371ADBF3
MPKTMPVTPTRAPAENGWHEPAEKRLFEQLAHLAPDHPTRQRIREDLAVRHQGLVTRLARRFSNRGEPLEDLLQSGNVGLVKAIDGFDVQRGHVFTAYAVPMILGEIRRHFRDTGWAIHVSRRLQNLKIMVHAARDDLVQTLGRRPTSREVARELDVSVAEAEEGFEVDEAYSCLSLDAMISDDNDRRDESHVAQIDRELDLVVDRAALWPLLSDLPDRERTVLLMRFFGNQTQSEIAGTLGVSQVQVSRLQARACSELRARLEAA